MSVSYVIDVACQMVISRAVGRLTSAELWHHQQQLQQDPAFDPTFRHLWDWTEVSAMEVTGKELRQFAMRSVLHPSTPLAIVAPNPVLYGLARMYQTLRSFQGENIAVFRTLEGARAWLGLADGVPQSLSGDIIGH